MTNKPTADQLAGMAWWNGLTEQRRLEWLTSAGMYRNECNVSPHDAWVFFKSVPPSHSYSKLCACPRCHFSRVYAADNGIRLPA